MNNNNTDNNNENNIIRNRNDNIFDLQVIKEMMLPYQYIMNKEKDI
jgi:hypothetical protein